MEPANNMHCTAFAGDKRIAIGSIEQVAMKAKAALDVEPNAVVNIFDDATGQTVEVDFRGTPAEVQQRLAQYQHSPSAAPSEPRGPGRPRLGVVAREVTLLPRHWDWLAKQPGGASVALRKLVEAAKKAGSDADMARQSREISLHFMSLMAGNQPGFEEVTRALFAAQRERFHELTATWPADIRAHARKLAEPSFHPAVDEN